MSHPQYHHYIPRFILRRWGVDTPSNVEVIPPNSRHTDGSPEGLNIYDLSEDTLSLGTETIARSFGISDMYKDPSHEEDVYHIEKSLSKLEQAASKVIFKLETERSSGLVTLLRSEVNTLRKFLFIMSFRNSLQHRSWTNETLDASTLAMLRNFVTEHGLTTIGEAYLLTMRNLLDTEHWEVENNTGIFWVTRTDYKLDKDNMSLALYEAPPGVEFILTENSFGIWEGVGGLPLLLMCQELGLPYSESGSFTLTRTYPISPKLALIQRSTIMVQEELSKELGTPWTPNIHGVPLGKSYFVDLPFQRTSVVYDPPPLFNPRADTPGTTESDFQAQWLRSLGGALNSRLRDRLTFRCFTLSATHARMINNLLLENCTARITFLNIIPLYKSIRFAYDRDTEIQHKVDYTRLKRKLIDAHRATQVTFRADEPGDDASSIIPAEGSVLPQNVDNEPASGRHVFFGAGNNEPEGDQEVLDGEEPRSANPPAEANQTSTRGSGSGRARPRRRKNKSRKS